MKQLFVLDPLEQINPSKDSSAALMQAAQRASIEVWACTPSDLHAQGDQVWVKASHVKPEPWIDYIKTVNKPSSDFDCIWMRKDPPVDQPFLYATHLLDVAERNGILVINKPASLRAWNEKLGALRFSHLMAPTLVGSGIEELIEFVLHHKEIVIKPLGGKGGEGVIRMSSSAAGMEALFELVTNKGKLPVMLQRFLPEVIHGDKRILLVNGEPLGAINRRPKVGDFRSNLAVGGQAEETELSTREEEICTAIAPALKEEGLFFVGIDVIDGMLSEINVTSPTGIREVEKLMSIPLADQIIDRLTDNFS